MASVRARIRSAIRRVMPEPMARLLRRKPPIVGARNVDVVLDGKAEAKKWLRATPDTYRVQDSGNLGPGPEAEFFVAGEAVNGSGQIIAVNARPLSRADRLALLQPLADSEIAASVLGLAALDSPGEPAVQPDAIALRRWVWDEVEGTPAGDVNLAGLYSRILQAGHHLALVPRPGTPYPQPRVDPIHGAGAVVVLAAVPLRDIGGGFRGAQIAIELCRRGFHVTYVEQYGSSHSVDLGLRFVHGRLEEYQLDDFDAEAYMRRLRTEPRLVIAEYPSSAVWTQVRRLSRGGFRVAYDLIDDWSDEALGGWWYRPEIEDALSQAADTLIGSAPALVENLRRRGGGRPVTLVPNGVNQHLFSGETPESPDDIPSGSGPLLSYHGSLYGDWFDWNALRAVAEAFPEARVMVIGDDHGHPQQPPNVYFLGLKPQSALPAYLARADASLIPFAVNETTHAVSPLKAFEALAMGVPVAAPPLDPLKGLEGVHLNSDLPAAVAAALAAPRPDAGKARAAHGWGERVGRIFDAMGLELPLPEGGEVLVHQRPPTRFSRDLRVR